MSFLRFGTIVQFKTREKHPYRSVTFSKVTGFLVKATLLHGCFSRFLNCTNGTKSHNTSQMYLWITFQKYETRVNNQVTKHIYCYGVSQIFLIVITHAMCKI